MVKGLRPILKAADHSPGLLFRGAQKLQRQKVSSLIVQSHMGHNAPDMLVSAVNGESRALLCGGYGVYVNLGVHGG